MKSVINANNKKIITLSTKARKRFSNNKAQCPIKEYFIINILYEVIISLTGRSNKRIYYGTAETTCELRKAKYFSYKKHKWNTEQSNKY